MFNYSDRFPTGSPLPTGLTTAVPWGVRRMRPYPVVPSVYARVEIDAETQLGRYLDHTNTVVEMPAHGTSSGTNPATGTGALDSRPGAPADRDTGNDADQ
ncbi:putative ATP-grasp-modified RiPP [Yinghuangia sp. ASG 101]|uniref:putative ATP-grasp-modified RiPP n=1 Tax=Yinghuangia sp. ASG 101 TaxID=2896848 RepID=UPI001E64A1DE|nr:putative ATP-grasp-modified RiPP [Yinghuangia sp. ASG 101]UGQ14746.1 putative ATP-grasp-modified RiPP [Yinghuangia sp. ASG 101]